MKKTLLLKSGCVVAALWLSATPALAAATYEGNLYEVISTKPQVRGAMGPIRSDESVESESVGRYEGDTYDQFRLPAKALRGAMGPIRSDDSVESESVGRYEGDTYDQFRLPAKAFRGDS
ncbi:MAG: hypothetical protein CVU18_15195 [Betaproteobacteria bacterium HGW-Betaproteobacteria-12]|jgi:hypothetical protein|nr:MAG: hypothetical protein CVU18_15195 [Betaproteobacteria bacterium HGW-Betaproteobacteria-12]